MRSHTCQTSHSLGQLIKQGLIRELYRQHHITQAQFEQLMRLQRA